MLLTKLKSKGSLLLSYVHIIFCVLSIVLLCSHPFIIESFTQPKQHRVFSKALLTEFHFPDELDVKDIFRDAYKTYNQKPFSEAVKFFDAHYLIAPAFRTDRTEAILIAASKYDKNGELNECGQVFALALFNYMKNVNFMARDIVFVFAENPVDLEKSVSVLINPDCKDNPSPSSLIPTNYLAAIIIQIKGSRECRNLGYFKIVPEGNQMLPYMDMLNTLTKVASRQGIKADFDFLSAPDFKLKLPSTFKSYIRTFVGHTSASHSFLLESKVDSVTIAADEVEESDEFDGIQELFRFFVISLRSFSNTIEHFQHESAIYVPLSGNDYLELAEVILFGIILIIPFALMALFELFTIWRAKKSKIELFTGAANAFVALLKVSTLWLVVSVTLFKFFGSSNQLSSLFVITESVLSAAVFLVQPKEEFSFLLSNVTLFIATLVCMFCSFGSGICLASLAMAAMTCFHLTNKLPFLLRLACLPFCTLNFWLKALLYCSGHDSSAVYRALVSNNYFINLMIVPTLILLHIQLQKKD